MYKAVIWHSESATLYYLIRANISDETDWEVIATFTSYVECENAARALNGR